MNEQNFEETFEKFWEECDSWVAERLHQITSEESALSGEDLAEIEAKVEEEITSLLANAIQCHGKSFSPHLLVDLHHLYFELALKRRGIKNEEHLHRYKDNGLVGLSAAQGKIDPESALLIMEVNRAHLKKKGGKEGEVCEDCICGKKDAHD